MKWKKAYAGWLWLAGLVVFAVAGFWLSRPGPAAQTAQKSTAREAESGSIVSQAAHAGEDVPDPAGETESAASKRPHTILVDDDIEEDLDVTPPTPQTEEKRVCLTFDDGPSANTESVLATLKEKGVLATFFVIGAENNKDYFSLVERELAEGHQVALHSCSHSYKQIYADTDAFWADIDALKEKLSPYISPDTLRYLRFPGGSTNTVSRRYGGEGIMKTLKAQAEERGYHWIDWNVCAEDAVSGQISKEQVYRNIVNETGDQTTCVVLMHDTNATTTTAQALPDVIDWYQNQGFRFYTVQQVYP